MLGVLLVAASSPVGAADEFVRGSATADASAFGLAIKQGAGSVGLTWGSSSTSYRDGYAAASAKPLDLQLVRLLLGEPSRCAGDTSPVPLPESIVPPEIQTNTMATTVGTEVTGSAEFPGLYDTPSPGPVGTGSAIAQLTGPSSTASVKANNINLIVAQIVNPSTSAHTELSGTTRIATATSRADELVFLWGLMTIKDPTWTATVKTGSETVHEGTFTVSGGTLWGEERTAEQAMEDLKATSAFIEDLLGYVGLAMDMPTTLVNDDFVTITPLMIRLTDSPLGKEILAPFLRAPQEDGKPTLEEEITTALDEWASETCDNKRYRQIAAIVLGLLQGSGALELPIGGASAGTDDTPPPEFEDLLPMEFDDGGEPLEPVDTYQDPGSYSYGGDDFSSYSYSSGGGGIAPEEPETTETTEAPSEGSGEGEVVEFAAPIASQTKTIDGVTGGAGIAIGLAMIVLATAGIVSERVLKARRLRKVVP